MQSLVVYAASGCNLRCKHCAVGSDQSRPRESLSLNDLCEVIRKAAAADVTFVTLIGGEVFFVHHDLSSVFQVADEHGIGISLNTNLLYPEKILLLKNFRSLRNISFSLDGASAQTHDKIRGRGTFLRVIESYEKLRAEFSNRLDVNFDLNFTLNSVNAEDAAELIALANRLGVQKINLALTEAKDFAVNNLSLLALNNDELLAAVDSFLFTWLAEGDCELDFHVPPLYSEYLLDQFRCTAFPANFSACGGTSVYGYIDNTGNHLPCPSMAFEHSRSSLGSRAMPALDVRKNDISAIWSRSLFKGFERSRSVGHFMRELYPCGYCVFRDTCRPCTHMVISGTGEPREQLCAAIAKSANPQLAKFKQTFLPKLNQNL
jgi:MoaA/NifB/PqqE/SkfB family radical SAM enzyme